MSPSHRRLPVALAAALLLGAVPASAQDLATPLGYLGGPPAQTGYGYGGNLVEGSYVGAPLTRFPSPREIAPTPWSYGTYGIPTVSGIRKAPVGEPVVYVIESPRPAERRRARAAAGTRKHQADERWSALSTGSLEERSAGGARIVEVKVPRR